MPLSIYKNIYYYSRFVVAHLIPRFAGFNGAIHHYLKCIMFATTSKLGGDEKRSQNTGPVPITDHAHERWAERAATAETDIETAWHQSIPVAAPERDADTARLYAPCDVLFVVRGGAVTTVYPANYGSLNTDGLGACTACGNLDSLQYGDTACRWCNTQPQEITLDSGLTVTATEEQ